MCNPGIDIFLRIYQYKNYAIWRRFCAILANKYSRGIKIFVFFSALNELTEWVAKRYDPSETYQIVIIPIPIRPDRDLLIYQTAAHVTEATSLEYVAWWVWSLEDVELLGVLQVTRPTIC